MKQIITLCLLLCFLSVFTTKARSEVSGYAENTVFGAKLIITTTNSTVSPSSVIFLDCLTTNSSTNTVCFRQTEVHGMYEVVLIDDLGKATELNNPANAGDSMDKMAGVAPGQAFECVLSLDLKSMGVESGHYRIVAKQKVHLIKDFDRKNALHGELVSNQVDVYLK